ncbi:glycosyltransferase family 2 protein [Rubellimicrobium sp. CFH 75288]|uniref:glycosyltransferase family 2 protein n=1 Tax=Rubellimicrobium sp. CFH 75288 TaxID=2697034 RepID=UPI0014133E5F|nr:glycosyltransferase [Rubellimicrobium sp. CFH 75288]NAZ38098.1 glycosyltransferase [Rubellimicrobium sp. CFH 75288]
MTEVGAVVVGRNEGERLVRCLRSLRPQVGRIVYVDSGSGDGSPVRARAEGVEVVELDPALPFTAARGRNAGFAALEAGGLPDVVQFVDGDCIVEPGWIAAAAAALRADPSLGLVTGWRTEQEPRRNLFHALAETEWRGPPGEIVACGGDMMVRAEAFRRAGGFDPTIIAAEDDEFCLRLAARTGLRLRRLPRIMTRHDAQMSRLDAWWRRAVRAGHGFAEVGRRWPGHFRGQRWRAVVYGLVLPLAAMGGLGAGSAIPALLVLGAYALNLWRTARGIRRARGLPWSEALPQAGLILLAKWPELWGMALFHLRRLRRTGPRLIEYK